MTEIKDMRTAMETLRSLQQLSERSRELRAEYDEIVRRKPRTTRLRPRAALGWALAPEPEAG